MDKTKLDDFLRLADSSAIQEAIEEGRTRKQAFISLMMEIASLGKMDITADQLPDGHKRKRLIKLIT